MYDKTVRRRRAVLALLVVSSLILLTAYFGESAGGGLHSAQRGVLDVVSPIQSGASRALKPFRDLFGWASDTVNATGEVKALRKERNALRQQVIAGQVATRENRELRAQLNMNDSAQLNDNRPVSARVIAQDPNFWFTQITIDKGAGDGLQRDQPVVTGEGLVGKVTFVTGSTAIVTLITDHSTQVGATVAESGVKGIIGVEAGRPTDLVLSFTSGKDVVVPNQVVVTSGSQSKVDRLPSPYPPGIPIGRVTRVDDPGSDSQQVHVAPFADLRRLDLVEVLTKPDTSTP